VVDVRVADGATIRPGTAAVRSVVEDFGGSVAAALGTRVVGVFPGDRVSDAVGAAVTVQRRAASARAGASDDGRGDWHAAVSVAMGPRLRADGYADLALTPVGPAIDRALDLCRGGLDESVVTDDVAAGLIAKVAPSEAATRVWSLGERRVLVGEGTSSMTCRQIEYQPVDGTDPEPSIEALVGRGAGTTATKARHTGARGSIPTAPGPVNPLARRRAWSSGRVCCWFNDRGRGVIASSTGQEFYVDRRFLVVSGDLVTGQTVFFVPRDPVARGRNPVAGAVLVAGTQLEARIEHVDDRGFGFAQLGDANGTRQLLLLDLTTCGPIARGDWLLVQVERGDHGPVARPVT